jgi:tetratricopeptide (TPR) repeat protein
MTPVDSSWPWVKAAEATRQWRWAAATAAGLTLLTLGLWLGEPDRIPPAPAPQGPWHDLPVARVAYTPAAEDTNLSQAMSPYTQGDFSEAERRLGAYLEERPGDRRAQLYRGVSLLLLGRTDEAIPPLESATAAAGSLGAEARWYLSLGLLKAGDTTRALAELDAVAQQSAQHLAESRALQVRVRASVR